LLQWSNGRIRITGDFKNAVNPQLHLTQYPLARAENLFENIAGEEKFTQLVGTDAFQQILLDEASKKCMGISTHRGWYEDNVLPICIAASPAIFQEFMDKLSQEVPQ